MLTAEQVRRQRTLTRERTRKWRARMVEAGLPDRRQVDQAIAAAYFRELRRYDRKKVKAPGELVEIAVEAAGALKRRGFRTANADYRKWLAHRIKAGK
jgi:hypothetical protein